jgi:hypothetical protein
MCRGEYFVAITWVAVGYADELLLDCCLAAGLGHNAPPASEGD